MAGGRRGRPRKSQIKLRKTTKKNDIESLSDFTSEEEPDSSKVARSLSKEMDKMKQISQENAIHLLESVISPLSVEVQNQLRSRASEILEQFIDPNPAQSNGTVTPQIRVSGDNHSSASNVGRFNSKSGKSWADEIEEEERAQSKTPQCKSSPWESFDISKLSSAGFKLHYVPPTEINGAKIGKIEQNDIQSEVDYWNCAVVCYVLGAKPPFHVMNNFIHKIWGKHGIDKVLMQKNGMLLVHFETVVGRDSVLETGIVHFDNKPLIVRPWSEEAELNEASLSKVPIWIKLPQLDLRYWGAASVSKICSLIGYPIMVDKNTEDKTGISFVRALVEVEIGGELPEEVMYENVHGRIITQTVEYEWKPIKCKFCGLLGHDENICRKKKPKQVWRPKKVAQTDEKKQTETEKEKENEWTVVTKGKKQHAESSTAARMNVSVQKSNQNASTSNPFDILQQGEGNDLVIQLPDHIIENVLYESDEDPPPIMGHG